MTHTLAQTDTNQLVLILGAFAGMLAGFYAVVRFILSQGAKDRDDDRDERKALVKALDNVAKTNKEIAEATLKAANEAEQRNGHLAEIVKQGTKSVLSAVQNVREQHVDKQVVDNQEVIEK